MPFLCLGVIWNGILKRLEFLIEGCKRPVYLNYLISVDFFSSSKEMSIFTGNAVWMSSSVPRMGIPKIELSELIATSGSLGEPVNLWVCWFLWFLHLKPSFAWISVVNLYSWRLFSTSCYFLSDVSEMLEISLWDWKVASMDGNSICGKSEEGTEPETGPNISIPPSEIWDHLWVSWGHSSAVLVVLLEVHMPWEDLSHQRNLYLAWIRSLCLC